MSKRKSYKCNQNSGFRMGGNIAKTKSKLISMRINVSSKLILKVGNRCVDELLVSHSGKLGSSATFSTCFQAIVPKQKKSFTFNSLVKFRLGRKQTFLKCCRHPFPVSCCYRWSVHRIIFLRASVLCLLCSMSR